MRNALISLIFIVVALSGCNRFNYDVKDNLRPVYIAAKTDLSVSTKSPYNGTTTPTVSAPLKSIVCVSTDNMYFRPDGPNGTSEGGEISKHIHVEFQSSQGQSLNDIYYNKDFIQEVYFTAIYPELGWNFSEDFSSVSTTFDGTKDIMFAPQVIGRYVADEPAQKKENQIPTLNFKHMLTYLKVEIGAAGKDVIESEAISQAWGKIRSMTISCQNSISINLADGTANFTGEKGEMNFYKPNSDVVFPGTDGYVIPSTSTAAAYVLCSPVMATNDDPDFPYEYAITLETDNRHVVIDIDLKNAADAYFSGNTAGYQFTIGLNFKMGNNIAVSAKIDSWETGGIGTGSIEQ